MEKTKNYYSLNTHLPDSALGPSEKVWGLDAINKFIRKKIASDSVGILLELDLILKPMFFKTVWLFPQYSATTNNSQNIFPRKVYTKYLAKQPTRLHS